MRSIWLLVVALVSGCGDAVTVLDASADLTADIAAADVAVSVDAAPVDIGVDTFLPLDYQVDLGPPRTLFISSVAYNGDLRALVPGAGSGIEAGDALCNQLAQAANLAGTYIAWLSGEPPHDNAIDRIASEGPWHLVNGARVFSSRNAVAGGIVETPIVVDETGATIVSGGVWTGSFNGQAASLNCREWADGTSGHLGFIGAVGATGSPWSGSGFQPCANANRIYCFEVVP